MTRLVFATTAYDPALFGNRIHEEFLQEWIGLGHDAVVFTPETGQPAAGADRSPIPLVRVPVRASIVDRGLNWVSGRTTHYHHFGTVLRAYLRYLRQHPEIDLIHVESVYPFGAIAALASFFDKRPFIPTIRGGDLIRDDDIGYGYARFRSVRRLLRLTFKRAAVVRSLSPVASRMALEQGCPPAKLAVVPRNIRRDCFVDDPERFRDERRRMLQARYPQCVERQIIVAAGRLLPIKGFDDLVRALPRVPNAVALICGPNRTDERLGDYAAYLTRLASDLGVADRVLLVGHVPPEVMLDYLAPADIVAVPSLIEGGNKILPEAAAVGTPFVATSTAGYTDLFTSEHGASTPPRRPELLGAALATLLSENPSERRRRRRACVEAARRFHPAIVTRELADLYTQVLASDRA